MPVALSVVGGLAAAVGLVLVAFAMLTGEPARAGLFVATGTPVFMAGVVLISVAAVVSELRRIVAAVGIRPAVRKAAVQTTAKSAPETAAAYAPSAPVVPAKTLSETTAPEAGKPAPEKAAPEKSCPAGSGRFALPTRRKRPAADAAAQEDGVVMAAQAASEVAATPAGAAAESAAVDGAQAAEARQGEEPPEATVAAAPHEAAAVPPAEPAEGGPRPAGPIDRTPSRIEAFDTFWPAHSRVARNSQVPPQPAPRAPQTPPVEAAPAATAPDAPSHAEDVQPAPPPSPAATLPVSIVKSGVVDGMAYTLYSDGSIEAQLTQGTVRFRSLAELRMHLERAA